MKKLLLLLLLLAAPLSAQTVCFVGEPCAVGEVESGTKCINLDPGSAVTDWLFFRTDVDITVTGIDCIVAAATSVVLTLNECDADGGTCGATESAITCAVTNTTEATSIDDPDVDAGDWMRVAVGTVTGTPEQVNLCVTYTVD